MYEITVPYARLGPVSELEILGELNPYAALSHLSALALHGLTHQLPQAIFVVVPASGRGDLLPAGTYPEDWAGLEIVRGRRVAQILDHPVHWTRLSPPRFFGVHEYRPRAFPMLATSPERALLDSLQSPDLAGGFENVLAAWRLARRTLDLETLVELVDRFDIDLLRQRTGFILETFGVSHAAFERWQASAHRGGSSKLLASAPYAPSYSERWNLSINAPIDVLLDGA